MLKGNIGYYIERMTKLIHQRLENAKLYIAKIDRRLDSLNPRTMLKHKEQILKEYRTQLNLLIQQTLLEKKSSYRYISGKLEALNPLAIMDKGYSISSKDGNIITDVTKVKKDDILLTKMKNGEIKSRVLEVKENGN